MMRLEKIMPVGRSSALTARQLADLLDTDTRTITRGIEAARLRGAPICSSVDPDNGGYYLAASAAELEDYLVERERRTRSIQTGTTAMRETLERMRENEKPPCAAEFGDRQRKRGETATTKGYSCIVPEA